MSAAELGAQLQSDAEFVRKKQEREAQRKALEMELREEEQQLLTELADVGIRVASVWELANVSWSYAVAIPTLLKHFHLSYHPKILEGIVRALTVHEARGIVGRDILDELKKEADKPGQVRWALANALTQVADTSMIDEIRMILKDPRYRDISEILTLTLKNLTHR